MSPLLVWALRFSEDFAADILAALAEHQRLRSQIAPRTSPAARARLRALLDEHARTGSPLPGGHAGNSHRAARSYLAALTGASLSQVSNILRDYGSLPVAGAALLDVPVTGQVHGQPWTPGIGYHEAQELAMCLGAACLIVVYLSGLRRPVIQEIQRGAVSTHYGSPAVTSDKTKLDPARPQLRWWITEPVAQAIAVAERLSRHPTHIFATLNPPAAIPEGGIRNGRRGIAARDDIDLFIAHINTPATASACSPSPPRTRTADPDQQARSNTALRR